MEELQYLCVIDSVSTHLRCITIPEYEVWGEGPLPRGVCKFLHSLFDCISVNGRRLLWSVANEGGKFVYKSVSGVFEVDGAITIIMEITQRETE